MGPDPFTHFMTVGWAEERNPSPLFDTRLYFELYDDVAQAGFNPLVHYLKWGAREHRRVSWLFDAKWYMGAHPVPRGDNPLGHYFAVGAAAGYEGNPLFDRNWYIARYPHAMSAFSALAHYAEFGARERSSPHPLFDADFYLQHNPDVAASGCNPLAHFLSKGHLERRQPHPLFDINWYLEAYPEVAESGINPLLHYLQIGAREGRDPNPYFDTAWYIQTQLDGASDPNPLAHYAAQGSLDELISRPMRSSGAPAQATLLRRRASGKHRTAARGTVEQEHEYFTAPGPHFEEFDPNLLNCTSSNLEGPDPLLLAFYLPQFHAVPENDAFWGAGFTEWRQLARALPRFPGHYQPRIPRDLGFYDLRNTQTIRRQAEMAKASGVGAFAFYYYWFNGKRVLHEPLDLLLRSDIDMPFLITWANENWTRTWDGYDAEVLLRQDYLDSDEDSLLADLARHFADKRYIRIGERPLFIIYNPRSIPEPVKTLDRWRAKLAAQYGLRPLIFMAQTFGHYDPRPYGFDGAIEFPPHKLSDHCPGRPTPDAYSAEFSGRVIDYEDYIRVSLAEAQPPFPLIKTLVPSWDNDPRRPNRGLSLEKASPAKYQRWLEVLIERAIDNPVFGAPIVGINAWNEWAESAYLEPDVHFGSAYLNATARAYSAAIDHASGRAAVSVIVPNYNHAQFLEARLRSIVEQRRKPAEIIFLDDASSDDSVAVAERILRDCAIPYRIVVNETNTGHVFKQWIKGLELAQHDLVWIAESDDVAEADFLARLLPSFRRDEVMAAFGRIYYIDENGAPLDGLDHYYAGLDTFSWDTSQIVPAFSAFTGDFAVKNVIPNASGLVFRKPQLSGAEIEQLYRYSFAGDWYFYALMARGGAIAYQADARSYFRLRQASTSRGAFFSERHLAEHKLILEDLRREYGISDDAVRAHVRELARHFPDRSHEQLTTALRPPPVDHATRPLRICIAAHSFAIGGGEVAPVELANALKAEGHHISYLVLEKLPASEAANVRARLRRDIPVFYWDDVADPHSFFTRHGVDVINAHNVGWEWRLARDGVDPQTPYIVTLHGGYETVPELMQREAFLDFIKNKVSAWLYLADKNIAALREAGVPRARFKKVFNAVAGFAGPWTDRAEFRRAHNIAADAFAIVLCSRAIEEKGWDIAIDAVAAVKARTHRPVHLVLIGDGPYLETARARAAGANNVSFLGRIEQPIKLLRCFDLGVLPSTYEGESFPLFLLECFQAGLPVIATDVGDIANMIGPDRAGVMLPAKGGPTAIAARLAKEIERLLESPDRFERLRAGAHAAAQRFSPERLVEVYVQSFREGRGGE